MRWAGCLRLLSISMPGIVAAPLLLEEALKWDDADARRAPSAAEPDRFLTLPSTSADLRPKGR